MTCQEWFERMEAYQAGALSQAETEQVEQHLLRCADCAADFRFRRTLRAGVAELPRDIAPERDLWAGIQPRLRKGAAPHRSPWWLAAAAAVALVTLSSAVTALLVRDDPRRVVPSDDFRRTEIAYRQAADELARLLTERRKSLGEPAYRVVMENLRIIDEAIQETQAALASDPRNQQVASLLWASYQKKIDLLERAADES